MGFGARGEWFRVRLQAQKASQVYHTQLLIESFLVHLLASCIKICLTKMKGKSSPHISHIHFKVSTANPIYVRSVSSPDIHQPRSGVESVHAWQLASTATHPCTAGPQSSLLRTFAYDIIPSPAVSRRPN
jgi:hypothetical protein